MIMNKYILDIYIYIYIYNPWKIFCDLRFLEVNKTTNQLLFNPFIIILLRKYHL